MTPFEHLEMLCRMCHADVFEWCADYTVDRHYLNDAPPDLFEGNDDQEIRNVALGILGAGLMGHGRSVIRSYERRMIVEIATISDVPAVQEARKALIDNARGRL